MSQKIISQGAEAFLFKQGNTVLKQRIIKSYRLPVLDEKLRKQRTKREIKSLEKALLLIPVPKVLSSSTYEITLEHIAGKKLSEHLDTLKNARTICKKIGIQLAKLHDANIIHGDLTTSNLILKEVERQGLKDLLILDDSQEPKVLEEPMVPYVVFIDFGLSFESSRAEDKAVDLHCLKEALEARHFKHAESFFKAVLGLREAYPQDRHYHDRLFESR